jgi:hypothetical protein
VDLAQGLTLRKYSPPLSKARTNQSWGPTRPALSIDIHPYNSKFVATPKAWPLAAVESRSGSMLRGNRQHSDNVDYLR